MLCEELDLLKVGVLFVDVAGRCRGVTGEQHVSKDWAGGGLIKENFDNCQQFPRVLCLKCLSLIAGWII